MLGTLYSFAVDKIDVLVVTPLVTLFLILDPTHPHFPTTVIPHRCHAEGLSATPVWESLKKGRLRKVEQDETKRVRENKKRKRREPKRESVGGVLGAWGTCVDVIWPSVMRRGPRGPVLIPKAAAWKRALGDYSTFMACRILEPLQHQQPLHCTFLLKRSESVKQHAVSWEILNTCVIEHS